MNIDGEKILKTGCVVGIVAFLLNWILSLFKYQVQELFATIPLATGITSKTGMKIVELLQGFLPINIMTLIGFIMSGIAITFIGWIIYGYVRWPARKYMIWGILMYGTLVLWLILVGLQAPALLTLIGLAIYYFVVCLIMNALNKKFDLY